MPIMGPTLRTWFGLEQGGELWHKIHISSASDPITRQPVYCVSQVRYSLCVCAWVLRQYRQYKQLCCERIGALDFPWVFLGFREARACSHAGPHKAWLHANTIVCTCGCAGGHQQRGGD